MGHPCNKNKRHRTSFQDEEIVLARRIIQLKNKRVFVTRLFETNNRF